MKRLAILLALALSLAGASAQKPSCNGCKKHTPSCEASAKKASAVIDLKEKGSLPIGAGRPVVVDFSATWCGPCRMFEPIFEKVAADFRGKAIFVHVDVDRSRALAQRYQVEAVPTLIMFDAKGKVKNVTTGAIPEEEFVTLLRKHLGLK